MIEFNSISNIPGNTQSTVLSFTNTGIIRYLRQIGIEGDADGYWQVFINMTEVLDRRTTTTESSFDFDMYSEPIQINDIIDIKVTHFRTTLQNFSSEIIITDTPEENITVIIDVNINFPLNGEIKTDVGLGGKLDYEGNFTGQLKTDNDFTGTLSNDSNIVGTLISEKDLNGVLTCIED